MKKIKKITPRGRVLFGRVIKKDISKTATVQVNHLHYIKKYERFEKRRSKIRVHNPEEINAQIGDDVKIQETRPISKTKHFTITEIIKK
jgi:small subunit ribosomal protein S17